MPLHGFLPSSQLIHIYEVKYDKNMEKLSFKLATSTTDDKIQNRLSQLSREAKERERESER